MKINNKYSFITIVIFTILFSKLNNAFNEQILKDQSLLLRCKKICQNNNKKFRKFCKKCHSLDMIDKNKISENCKIYKEDIISENKNSSIVLLSSYTKFDYNKIENLIVFGDSHSFAGNEFTTKNYSSKYLKKHRNWPIKLIEFHKMKLYSFAESGSVIDSNILDINVIDFSTEYETFTNKILELKDSNQIINRTLFSIQFGSNDVHIINKYKIENVNSIITKIVDSMFVQIEKLYNFGARNLLILNISPLDNAPINSKGRHNYYTYNISFFIDLIKKKAKLFYDKFPYINIIIYDTNSFYKYIMKNCKLNTFDDCTNAQEENIKKENIKFFWRDFTHISEKGNIILAKDINNLLNSINK